MVAVPGSLLHSLRFLVRSRAPLHLEILALRHQLSVVPRSRRPRLRLTSADRVLWARLAFGASPGETRDDHRMAPARLRLFWTWKSRRRSGRPGVSKEVRALIRERSSANPLWGAPRIHGELLKLGISVRQSTVAKSMRRHGTSPSQSWRTFLTNHAGHVSLRPHRRVASQAAIAADLPPLRPSPYL